MEPNISHNQQPLAPIAPSTTPTPILPPAAATDLIPMVPTGTNRATISSELPSDKTTFAHPALGSLSRSTKIGIADLPVELAGQSERSDGFVIFL